MIIVLIYVEGYILVYAILHNSHYPAFSVVNYGANVQKIYDMKKFTYKKMVDSYVFHKRNSVNGYELSVVSLCKHPQTKWLYVTDFFRCEMPTPVGSFGLAFLCALGSSDMENSPVMEMYYSGRLYTLHIDRYNHIIFRIYRVVK